MSDLVRFGISVDRWLLESFDQLIRRRHYTNRSEAIRDLIRQELAKKEIEEDREVAGAITFIYDHHQRELLNRITDIQHNYLEVIKSSQHIHLDHHNCLEVVAVKGRFSVIDNLFNSLRSLKGVVNASLSISTNVSN
ncbi:MAG: nickel-responsive transcriptional regulator NikR [Syntrophales bacterium]|nr:nickel-responsive transcriptional regulator NikR [Syntrophales bacterium]